MSEASQNKENTMICKIKQGNSPERKKKELRYTGNKLREMGKR